MRRWLVLTFLLGLAAEAAAQSADRSLRLGRELFEAQEYAAARLQFMRAYEASPSPALLFDIGLTYQGEGLFRQAQLYFERYAAEVPPSEPNRAEAERLAGLMKRAADRGDGRGDGSGESPREGGSDRLLPLFEDTAVDPDRDDIGLVDDDYDDDDDDDDELPSKERTARILFWTSAAVAAAAATTLIVAAYNVDHYEDELNDAVLRSLDESDPQNRIEGDGDACDVAEARTGVQATRAQNACDYGKSWARTANVMTLGLIATGITSMYFLYVGYLQGEGEERVVPKKTRNYLLTPSLAPREVGVALEMRF